MKQYCKECKYCHSVSQESRFYCWGQKNAPEVNPFETCESWKSNKTTNADHIRNMSDKDLAKWIEKLYGCSHCLGFAVPCDNQCEKYWLEWLHSPYGGDAE